jgi:GTP pyrophosphokinase
MPKGSTPLDFAYRIHSAVGNKCIGAKVNGKLVPLDTELATGDRVEIMTSASSKGPSSDWIRICRTPQAKAKIRQYLKKELRQENLSLGREMIEHECARRGVRLGELLKPEYYESMLKKYGFSDFDDICCAVGYGGMAAQYVVTRLIEEQRGREVPSAPAIPEEIPDIADEKQLRERRANHGIVLTENEDLDIPIRFARCCSPVPGDEIVGYITRGRGVTIHKAECPNAAGAEPERKIPVEWASESGGSFYASIKILVYDRVNMLGEIASIVGEMNVSIKAAQVQTDDRTRISTVKLTLDVTSREQMDRVIQAIRNKADVLDVYRITG